MSAVVPGPKKRTVKGALQSCRSDVDAFVPSWITDAEGVRVLDLTLRGFFHREKTQDAWGKRKLSFEVVSLRGGRGFCVLVACRLPDPRPHVLQGGLVDPMDDLVVMNPGRWVYVMSCILGRVEGVPGDGSCPRQLAQHLLTSSELKLRAEVGHLPVFPAFVPRGQAPMVSLGGGHRAAAALHVRRASLLQVRFGEPAESMSEAFGQRCSKILGRSFGLHLMRRFMAVAAELRLMAEDPSRFGVDEATRRGASRAFGWAVEAAKMGIVAYEQHVLDNNNFMGPFSLGFTKTDEWQQRMAQLSAGGC